MSNRDNATDSLVLTPVETAKLLRIGRGTVYEQIRCGVIPSIRMGRKILVPKVALMKMLETAKGQETHPAEWRRRELLQHPHYKVDA